MLSYVCGYEATLSVKCLDKCLRLRFSIGFYCYPASRNDKTHPLALIPLLTTGLRLGKGIILLEAIFSHKGRDT